MPIPIERVLNIGSALDRDTELSTPTPTSTPVGHDDDPTFMATPLESMAMSASTATCSGAFDSVSGMADQTVRVSGFSDEIAAGFDEQLRVVTSLGMSHVCLRAADGKGIADFTLDEARLDLLPRLRAAGVAVSALGSPIGKIDIGDEDGFTRQLAQLDVLCDVATILGTDRIRMFSFYIPKGDNPDDYADAVLTKVRQFEEIARRHQITLVLENEKYLFGDIGRRCDWLLREIGSPNLQAAFDFANFVQCDDDPVACWALLHDYVADIHIKDARYNEKGNVLCGSGDGRIGEILSDALAGGFASFLTLEPHLATFDTFALLEREAGLSPLPQGAYASGAEAYEAQYVALQTLLAGTR
jgi:sugar phosphate isomerase/epimerase